jgi:hypothetical protein
MADDVAQPTFDMPGDRQYTMIRAIPAFRDEEYYTSLMESFEEAATVRGRILGGALEREARENGATDLSATPAPQAATAPDGGGSSGKWDPQTGFYCPTCDHPSGGLIEVKFTADKYQSEERDKWYHPYPKGKQGPEGGKTHTVWQRQLVTSDGSPLSAAGGQGTLDAPPQADDDDPF